MKATQALIALAAVLVIAFFSISVVGFVRYSHDCPDVAARIGNAVALAGCN